MNKSIQAPDFLPMVDVLRAIAITLVVLYHAVPGLLPSGFVGVDVFFVISGFLILGPLWRSVEQERLGLITFLKRRALRIIPPYAVVMVASSIAACLILVTPQELRDFQRDLLWSGSFSVNLLYTDVLGYFDNVAARHPLLHLWSLAVEAQFYILAPLASLAIVTTAGLISRKRRLAIAAVAAASIACVSLAACLVLSGLAPQQAFYLPICRLWEFLVGGALPAAVLLGRQTPSWLRGGAILTGLGLILSAAAFHAPADTYPGYLALLPVLGASLVVAAGLSSSSGLARLLGTPPVLFLGLISYEVYLWHWPILAFTRFFGFGTLPVTTAAICVAATLVLASATHFALVGTLTKLRRERRPARELIVLVALLVGYAVLVVGLGFGLGAAARNAQTSVPPLLVPDVEHRSSCNVLEVTRHRDSCGATTEGKGVGLVLGDSHAGANFSTFAEEAHRLGAGLEFASFAGCSPFLTIDRLSDSYPADCRRWHGEVSRALRGGEIRFDFAILTAQWMFHIDDLIGSSQEIAFKAGLSADIDLIKAAGAKRVLIIGAPPLLPREPGDCIIRADRFAYDRNRQCAEPRANYAARTRHINAWIATVIAGDSAVRFVDPTTAFCGSEWCSPVAGNVALFSDHDHLSSAGVARLVSSATDDFVWVMSTAP